MLANVCRKKTPSAISSTCPVGFQSWPGGTAPDQRRSASSLIGRLTARSRCSHRAAGAVAGILPLTAARRPCEMERANLPEAPGDSMAQPARFRYEAVEGADALFTATFVDYLLALHDRLGAPIRTVLSHRAEAVRRAVTQGALPTHPPRGPATTGDWKVPPVPADLRKPG